MNIKMLHRTYITLQYVYWEFKELLHILYYIMIELLYSLHSVGR